MRVDALFVVDHLTRARQGGAMAIVHVIQENVRGCRSVAFDEHGIQRMNERNVREDDVLEVLRNPTQTGLPTAPNRLRLRKHTGANSWIDVVFEEDPTQIVVFSVWRK